MIWLAIVVITLYVGFGLLTFLVACYSPGGKSLFMSMPLRHRCQAVIEGIFLWPFV